MNLWKWKRTTRLEGEQPVAAIHSSTAEATVPAAPVDVAVSERPVDIADPERLPAFTLPPAGVSLERSFCQDGFVVVPQVFDQTEIAEIRRAAIAEFPNNRPPFEPTFSNTALFQEPFQRVFRNRKFIQALRSVAGEDFVFVNEFALHDSFYAGWHTDTTSPEFKADHEFHWSPGFCLVQVAIYLQDNGEDGGGLDVVPGSYIRDDPLAATMRRKNGLPSVSRMTEPSGGRSQFDLGPATSSSFICVSATVPPGARRMPRTISTANLRCSWLPAPTTRRRGDIAWLDEYGQMNGTTRPAVPDDFRSLLSGVGHSVL